MDHNSSPFAGYRPGNVSGLAAGDLAALSGVGLAFYSGLAVLEQERDQLLAEAGVILQAIAAGGKSSAEQGKRLVAINERLDGKPGVLGLTTEIANEQYRREHARGVDPVDFPAGFDPDNMLTSGRSTGRAGQPRRAGVGARRDYAGVFGLDRLDDGGFPSFNDYLATVHAGLADPRLQTMAAANERIGSAGGFAVPEAYTASLLDASLEDEIVRPRANFVPLTGETTKAPVFDGQDHSAGALFGGLTPRWLDEEATGTNEQPKLALLELHAHKVGLFALSSNELVADGRDYETQLGNAMIKGCSWGLDYAFLNGNGVAKPRGVLHDPALIVVAKETGQLADTIVYENLVKMFARMHPAGVGKSIWIANMATIPQLLTLSMAVGTGGVTIPVLSQSGGQFSILTRPVVFTEKVPTLGDEGDISLVDLSQYSVGLRKEAVLEKSIHVGWQTDQAGYRTILRADGRGSWTEALTPRNGPTLSWAVTLAAR